MSTPPLFQDLHSIDVPLANIFLDPNNPRFVDSNWIPVTEADYEKPDIQEAVQRRLVKDFEVEKLRTNMEVNGYLPIDRVIVQEYAKGRYVVLEGNRRICAAKMISDVALDGSQISAEVSASLKKIPCLQYTGTDNQAAWIFQGLRHIVGIVEWSAFNKAKLLVEQMEKEGLNLTSVGRRFGLTSHGAGQWIRGYYAFNQACENSDYINEVDERSYTFFQELFGRSSAPVREWLQWDDEEYKFKNLLNFNEFIGWLYPKDANADGEASSKGDWEKRRLVRRDDLRTLSFLMTESHDHFIQFRNGTDLERSYSAALAKKFEEEAKRNADVVGQVFDAIAICTQALENIPLRAIKDDPTKNKLFEVLLKLEKAIADIKS
jgi:hypothetical protein